MLLNFRNVFKLFFVLILILFTTACSAKNPLIGRWVSENNDIVEFNEDGTCTAPFTYSAAWIDEADKYVIKDDGTLVFSSPEGHANDDFKKVETKEEALDDKNTYFISEDTLIIEKDEYIRAD